MSLKIKQIIKLKGIVKNIVFNGEKARKNNKE